MNRRDFLIGSAASVGIPLTGLSRPINSLVASSGEKSETGGGGGSPLPPEYQLVEYLRSEGATQYITLSRYATLDVEFEIIARIHVQSDGGFVLGASSGGVRYGGVGYTNYNRIRFVSDSAAVYFGGYYANTIFTAASKNGVASFEMNGNIKSQSWVWNSGTREIQLFTCATSRLDSSIYHCRIWVSGDLKHDLFPCYRKSDSVAGMYDLASDTFWTNSGTGAFTIGPDI